MTDETQSPLLQAAWRGRLQLQSTEAAARPPAGEWPGRIRSGSAAAGANPMGTTAAGTAPASEAPGTQTGAGLARAPELNVLGNTTDASAMTGVRGEAGAGTADGQAFGELLRAERQEVPSESGRLDLTRPAQTAERLTQVLQAHTDGLRGDGAMRTLRFVLNPVSLGEMDVQFAQNERGEVTIRITTASAVTREVLEPHLAKVRMNLEELGLRLGSIDVQVAQQDARQPQQQPSRQGEQAALSARSQDALPAATLTPEQELTPRPAPLNRLLDTFV